MRQPSAPGRSRGSFYHAASLFVAFATILPGCQHGNSAADALATEPEAGPDPTVHAGAAAGETPPAPTTSTGAADARAVHVPTSPAHAANTNAEPGRGLPDAASPPAGPAPSAANTAHDAGARATSPAPAQPVQPAGAWTGFLGGDDAPLLARVCDGTIERMERNRGGSTISFRVWFGGGARGLFKPQQRSGVANFRAELAAYRLSRLLGLHRVPPACGRVVARERLQTIADASGDATFSDRVLHELLGRTDTVPGAMLYWVPGPLENVPGTNRWPELLDASQTLADADTDLAADLARLILFDFLTDNVDRWSGGNILRQHLANQPPSPMLFMDNGAAFTVGEGGLGARPREQADRLARVGRLPRALLAALRALTPESLRAAMREDPLGNLLSDAQIQAVITRRDRVVAHADELVQARGEAAVMVFP